MRKKGLRVLVFMWLALLASRAGSQTHTDTIPGEVTYLTSQSVYVRFPSTQMLSEGDTLYLMITPERQLVAALTIKYLSSTSCVGTPVADMAFEKGMSLFAMQHTPLSKGPDPEEAVVQEILQEAGIQTEAQDEVVIPEKVSRLKPAVDRENIKGRITAASYSNFSDNADYNRQRMRYTLTLHVREIGQTGLSVESYMSFRHTINQWEEVQHNFLRTFKVFNLAVLYAPNEDTRLWVGRKINHNLSNIGAIDGLQAEKKWNRIRTGVFAGTRPDLGDYGFNAKLLQVGAYVAHLSEGKSGTVQTTLALAEQRNGSMTDRRFAYVQHLNSTIPRINIFTSFEFDLYALRNNQPTGTFDITSMYLSVRYRMTDRFSLFGSYDARKNIIYYETYRNIIDQLLEDETRQGLRLTVNFRPVKKISIGSTAGYRFQKDNAFASKNLNSYITFSRIPVVHMNATLSATWIQSPYLDGLLYGVRMSRDIIKGKVFGEVQYRRVRNNYQYTEIPLQYAIAGAQLSWRLNKKLSVACNYEGEMIIQKINHRLFTHIVQRL